MQNPILLIIYLLRNFSLTFKVEGHFFSKVLTTHYFETCKKKKRLFLFNYCLFRTLLKYAAVCECDRYVITYVSFYRQRYQAQWVVNPLFFKGFFSADHSVLNGAIILFNWTVIFRPVYRFIAKVLYNFSNRCYNYNRVLFDCR